MAVDRAGPGKHSSHRPVLAVDVDGVISLFGFPPDAPPPGDFHLVDGIAHCIATSTGPRLLRLADHFDLVWATGWEERASEYLPAILGIPAELPHLVFDGRKRFGTAHWKLEAITEHAAGRPLAWVDDCLDDECQAWAETRSEPTLLVPTEPEVGLLDAHVEAMIRWAQDGYTAAP